MANLLRKDAPCFFYPSLASDDLLRPILIKSLFYVSSGLRYTPCSRGLETEKSGPFKMLNVKVRPTICAAFLSAVVLASLSATTVGHAANVYIWRDADGIRQYSDTCPPDENCRVKVVRSSSRKGRKSWNSDTSTTSSSDADTGTTTSDTTTSNDTTSTNDTTTTSGTTAESKANQTASLEWDAVDDESLGGYRIYYAAAGTYYQPLGQGTNVGNVATHTVTNLSSGTRYYFTVTAVDTSNNESSFSNEVYKDIP